jgi:outer membrane protein
MRFQLGVEPSAEIELTDNLDGLLAKINTDQAVVGGNDLTLNINYQMSESQVEISKKQVDMQNWAYSPTIAGFYSYTKKILTTGFDLTPNNLAGVTVTVPVFSSGMRRAQVSQAKINYDVAVRNQEMAKEQLEIMERQLVFNYQSALENFNTQKENVDVAKSVYQNIQNKYKQGLVSSLDLTQANSNLLNAEGNYTYAVQSLLQAQTSLDKLYNRF